MEQQEMPDQELRKLVQNEKEKVLQVLGHKHVAHWNATGKAQNPILVLTDTRLHQAGLHLAEDEAGRTRKARGQQAVSLKDVTGFTITEKPVPRWVAITGVVLIVLGLAMLAWSLVEGSVMALSIALFVGVAWMAVPGALVLLYVKTGAQKLLQITHRAGHITVPCHEFDEGEVDAFLQGLTARTGK